MELILIPLANCITYFYKFKKQTINLNLNSLGMKQVKFLLILPLFIIIFGCDNDNGSSAPEYSGNVVEITENITEVTTWYADSVYVIRKWDLWVTNTLTIQAGTVIKFTDDGPGMAVGSGGTILANGTGSSPIIFTSIKDDSYGGDNNSDGDATTPDVKDWGMIWIEANGSRFINCHFYYGGNSGYPATLQFYDVTGTVRNSVFAHNYGGKSGDFYYGALSADNAKPSIVIENNVFYDNNLPLSIPCENSLDASNVFHDPDNSAVTNTMNGIFTYANDEFTISTTWSETEVPYVINDNDLWIEGSWILATNVIVKFTAYSSIVKEPSATFSYDESNYFTSFKDDDHGGDTNGDGSSSGTIGDWYGMEINDGYNTPICGANILYSQTCN